MESSNPTTTQIDRLGDRLREGPITDADLRELDVYGASFGGAYAEVVLALTGAGLRPSGRERKSNQSIVDKLRRESVRLSQIQDIAGCRVVVTDMIRQNAVAQQLASALAPTKIVDRRAASNVGYRAVHVIVVRQRRLVEVQIRTALQHYWAATSEKLADEFGHGLKYGQGPGVLTEALRTWSASIQEWENWLQSRETAPRGTLTDQTRIEGVHQRALQGRVAVLAVASDLRRQTKGRGE